MNIWLILLISIIGGISGAMMFLAIWYILDAFTFHKSMKKRTFYPINELSGQPHEDVDRQEGEDDIE